MINLAKLFNAAQLTALTARKDFQNRLGIPDNDAPLDPEKVDALFVGLNMLTSVFLAGILAHCKDEQDQNQTIEALIGQAKALANVARAESDPQGQPGKIIPVNSHISKGGPDA